MPYVQRVLKTIYHLDGEATRRAYTATAIDLEVVARLEALFSGEALAAAKSVLAGNALEGFVRFADPPAPSIRDPALQPDRVGRGRRRRPQSGSEPQGVHMRRTLLLLIAVAVLLLLGQARPVLAGPEVGGGGDELNATDGREGTNTGTLLPGTGEAPPTTVKGKGTAAGPS